jgi:hypothetical protein
MDLHQAREYPDRSKTKAESCRAFLLSPHFERRVRHFEGNDLIIIKQMALY